LGSPELELLLPVPLELLEEAAGKSLFTISCFASTLLVPGLVRFIFILRPLSAAAEWSILTLTNELVGRESVDAAAGLDLPPATEHDAEDFPFGVFPLPLAEDCPGECGICICGDGVVDGDPVRTNGA
jgi:hypothetical protein